jgi:hypothetical protein
MTIRLDSTLFKMFVSGWLVIPILVATACGAQDAEPVKPACNAQTQGKLWPEKTSWGNGAPIEICATKYWKFRWEQLTVDISQLKARHKPAIAAVPVTPATGGAGANNATAQRE